VIEIEPADLGERLRAEARQEAARLRDDSAYAAEMQSVREDMESIRACDVHLLRAPRDARGDEQGGLRYAVVLQSDYLAELSTWLVAPTSTSALPLSFRPRIEMEGQPTLLLVDQLAAADLTLLGRAAGRLTTDELTEANAALRIVLGLR
jgi:mRNA interferase MazF